jgi:general secretion pathway protein K
MKAFRQQGVALISALLVVALATTAAARLMSEQHLSMRHSGNLFMRDQAWQYLQGGEEFAMVLIDKAVKHDRLQELLGQDSVFPVEGGTISGKITDLQGRFNINSVVNNKGKVDGLAYERLQNLLAAVDINTTLADAIVDWLDADSIQSAQNGAEDDYYLGLSPPYRAANSRLESLSELMLVRGYKALDEKKRKQLEDSLATLPTNTAININTASDDILKAIGIKDDGISTIHQRLAKEGPGPFKSVNEIKALKLVPDDKLTNLGVTTEYFQLTAVAQIGRARLKQYSIIHRSQKGAMRVISRSLSTQ